MPDVGRVYIPIYRPRCFAPGASRSAEQSGSTRDESINDKLLSGDDNINVVGGDLTAENPETVERYRAIAMAVLDATKSLADSLAYMRLLNSTADDAGDSVSRAERALQRVQQQIDNAQVIVDDEGRRLLQEAVKEQRETGQQSQQLTDLAHEARHTVEQYVT